MLSYREGCYKKILKKPVFRHLYKIGRISIHMSVIISSTQDSRFVKPKTFHSIPAISKVTGISLRAVRNGYHSKRTSTRKASSKVYTIEWQEPFIPKDPRECYHCCKTLTVKEKSTWFHMERDDIKELPMTFTFLYVASKITGISDCAKERLRENQQRGN